MNFACVAISVRDNEGAMCQLKILFCGMYRCKLVAMKETWKTTFYGGRLLFDTLRLW